MATILEEEVAIPISVLANEQSPKKGLQNNEFQAKPTNYSAVSSPTAKKPPLTRRKNKTTQETRFGEDTVLLDSETLDDLLEATRLSNQLNQAKEPSFSEKITEAGGSDPKEKKEEEDGPSEREIYKKVTEQLRTRNSRRMTVKLVLQLLIFLAILVALICSLKVDAMKGKLLGGIKIWKWFTLLMSIFSGMLIIGWVVHCVVFIIEWKFFMKKNVVYFTHALHTNVVVLLWIVVVLITWVVLFKHDSEHSSTMTPTTKRVLDIITWTLAALLIGTFLWLVKTTLVKMLASSFHLNRFFGRIEEAVFHHYVLQTLSGKNVVQLTLGNEWQPEVEPSSGPEISRANSKVSMTERIGGHTEKKVVDWNKLHQMKEKKVPSYTMKLLVDVISNSGISTMSSMLNKDVVEGGVELDDNEISNVEEAVKTAVSIFDNVTRYQDEDGIIGNFLDDKKERFIGRNDLHKFLIWAEVDLVYPKFGVKKYAKIDLKTFAKWVVQVYKDRVALQHALNDNHTAVDDFNRLLNGLLIIIMIIVWLLMIEVLTTKMLVFLTSQLLVAVFIFGNSAKTVFEAIIFVFVMHPFDVGDRCVIDGTVLLVEEMNILTTVFLKLDKEKVYYPNSVLATKSIGNYYRSPHQMDTLEFAIDYKTPLKKIEDLKARIKLYLDSTPHFWHPEHQLIVKDIENVNKLKMALIVTHTMNFQEIGEKVKRRSELFLKVKSLLDELEIAYHLLPQEIHVTNMSHNYQV